MICHLQGEYTDRPRIDPRDAGLLLGDGIFETVRVCGGRAFRFAAHHKRLAAGLEATGIAPPATRAELESIVRELARRNAQPEGLARITITRGLEARGSTLLVHLRPLPKAPAERPARVVVARTMLAPFPGPRCKSTSYQPWLLAGLEAAQAGMDEALICNREGQLVEGARSNLFWVEGETLCTPALDLGALPGTLRAFVLAAAAQTTIEVRERRAGLSTLQAADEVFLSSSGVGIWPVAQVEDRMIGSGGPGQITHAFRRRLTRALEEHRHRGAQVR